ncbi:MAG: Xaa-Pro peptidase family protein [Lentisphaeria bacterium]|nr:Xaa-Pro peptidase family protein [Lentisphaeria bacterium]
MFESIISIDEYRQRRQRLRDRITPASALVMGAPAPDDRAPFRQYNEFCYLCGVLVPQSYLFIDGRDGKTTLFLPGSAHQSRERNDKLLFADDPETAMAVTGVDAVSHREQLAGALAGGQELYILLHDGEGLQCDVRSITDARRQSADDPWDGRPDRGTYLAEKLRRACPGISLHDLAPVLLEMRLIKSPTEIDLLREAGRLAAEGVRDAMRATKPGVMEYELAALLQYRYLAGGALDYSYAPIVAAGKNIVDPHYCANRCELRNGDLVLVDCAPDYHYYTSDITRIWPVNGVYTEEQRTLYGFVTEYHKALLAAIRPGRTCADIEDEVAAHMETRLGEFQFATPAQYAAVQRMLQSRNHIAHSVGMSVHDGLGHKTGPLQPGMVFAVDPQLWLKEENLYIRVEDTGVVTESGFDVFTADITLDLDEIEMICEGVKA